MTRAFVFIDNIAEQDTASTIHAGVEVGATLQKVGDRVYDGQALPA